ncbi:hypothetical protein [uncultured Salinicola sp.]|uniref:hypothetical protein n=1 Tax=uncultured Salinicola sp. TaxID=1193542 RepID=UPI00262B4951|nr:hypothetical protein [uncultured Salinicola sp.]|tara:strand:- start:5212 stop:5472 length:261 start_codon:yes stop_codon:yes gene_type:complete
MDEGEAAIAIGDALKDADMKVLALDTGEIFVEMPDGSRFALSVEEVDEFPVDLDEDDLDEDDGTSGQDRESYSDDQDRESYHAGDD